MPSDLTPLLAHLPAWLLVLVRLTGVFFYAPELGSKSIPVRVKVLLALGLSFCVYPMLLAAGASGNAAVAQGFASVAVAPGLSLWSLIPAIATELLIGLALGFGAALPMVGMQLAGQIADQQLGYGVGGLFNPDLDEENGPVGQLYFMTATALYVGLGGHRLLLSTLVGSYGHVPLGGFAATGDLARLLLGMTTASFELALRVSAPLLCLVFLESVVMGFLARTVPQMNIMSVGFALRILIGSAVILTALGAGLGAYTDSLGHTMRELSGFLTG